MLESGNHYYPKSCLNTNCKTQFARSCHLGWLPCTFTSAYCVMKCSKCHSKFKIRQSIDDTYQYYKTLPNDMEKIPKNKSITPEEIRQVKEIMSKNNVLKDLSDGMIPGLSQGIKPQDDESF